MVAAFSKTNPPYITPHAQIGISKETTFANEVTTGFKVLGLVPSVDLPDPEIDVKQIWSVGQGPDLYIQAEGANKMTGSIPVVVQDATVLAFGFGSEGNTGASPTTHVYPKSVRGNVFAGGNFITDEPTYMPSFTLRAEYGVGSGESTPHFTRDFTGTVVNSMELSSEEEGELRATLGIMSAIPIKTSNTSLTTMTTNTSKPYLFHQGVFTYFGSEIARVKSFRYSLNNNLSPRFYQRQAVSGRTGDSGKYALEFIRGNRQHSLETTFTVNDRAVRDLLNSLTPSDTGTSGSQGTFTCSLVFTRGTNDTLTLTARNCWIQKAPHSIPESEDVPITMSILPETVQATIVDSTSSYL